MAVEVTALRIGIIPTDAKAGAKQVEGALAGVSRSAGVATRGVRQTETAFEKLKREAFSLRGALAALGLTLGIRELVRYADTWTLIEGRLRLVTNSARELAVAQGELFQIAQQTRTSFEATAAIFTRAARNADQLGASQAELLQFTEALNKSIVVSGATAQEASAGLIQLSQALASGRLSGEEYRAVSEQLPDVLLRIQEATGKTAGELRAMAHAQELTADIVVSSILKTKDAIDRDFASMPVTIGQAFTVLGNSATKTIGELNQMTATTSVLAGGIIGLAANLDVLADALIAVASAALLVAGAKGLAAFRAAALAAGGAVDLLIAKLTALKAAMGVSGWLVLGAAAVGAALFGTLRAMRETTEGTDQLNDALERAQTRVTELAAAYAGLTQQQIIAERERVRIAQQAAQQDVNLLERELEQKRARWVETHGSIVGNPFKELTQAVADANGVLAVQDGLYQELVARELELASASSTRAREQGSTFANLRDKMEEQILLHREGERAVLANALAIDKSLTPAQRLELLALFDTNKALDENKKRIEEQVGAFSSLRDELKQNAVEMLVEAERLKNGAVAAFNLSVALNDKLTPAYRAELIALNARNEELRKGIELQQAMARAPRLEINGQTEFTTGNSQPFGSRLPFITSVTASRILPAAQKEIDELLRAGNMVEEAWRAAMENIQRTFAGGFKEIFKNGINGFRDFARSLLDIFTGLAAEIAAAMAIDALGIDELIKKIKQSGINGLSGEQKMLGAVAVGAGIGTGTDSGWQGAAGGAAAGAAIGGPWGAVLGGVTGLVTGLWGQAKNAAEAAKIAAEAAKQQQAAVASWRNTLEQGFGNLSRPFENELVQSFNQLAEAYGMDLGAKGASADNILRYFESVKELAGSEFVGDFTKLIDAFREAQAELEKAFNQDLSVRMLAAQGRTAEADALRLALTQQRELDEARQKGFDDATLAALALVHAAESARIAAEQAEQAHRKMEDLEVRRLSALGQNEAAEAMRLANDQRREMQDALASGASAAFIALLAVVHDLERAAFDAQRSLDTGITAINAELEAQTAAIDSQLSVAQEQLSTARDALRTQERMVEDIRRVRDSLADFGKSLLIGDQSALSPIDQLAEARSQFETLTALARGGDATAAASLPEAARALLEASREVNASAPGYVSDFNNVRETIAQIEGIFGNQLSVEELILDELNRQTSKLQKQINQLEAAKAAAMASAERQIAALQQIRDITLATLTSTTETDKLLASLADLADTVDASGRKIIMEQKRSLHGTRDALDAATQAQIAAIQAGAPAHELAMLDQTRRINLLRNDYNRKAVEQIHELAAIHGYGSAQVMELERQRVAYLASFEAMIQGIESLGEADELLAELAALGERLAGVGRDVVAAQMLSLQGTRDALEAVTAEQIAAIEAGAPQEQVALLDQIRALNLLRNNFNTQSIRQINELAAIHGYDSQQVLELEAQRQAYLGRYDSQIDYLRSQLNVLQDIRDEIESIVEPIPPNLPPITLDMSAMTNAQQKTNDELKATVRALQAGFQQVTSKLADVEQELKRNTRETKRVPV